MRSIRSSTMTYLVVLMAIALSIVAVVIDRVTEKALAAWGVAGRDLINKRYEDQCSAERNRMDEALKKQATSLYSAMSIIIRRDMEDFSTRYVGEHYDTLSLSFMTNPLNPLAEATWAATGNRFLSQIYFSNLPPIPKEVIQRISSEAGGEEGSQDYQQINLVPPTPNSGGAREWHSESLAGRKLQDPKEVEALFTKQGKTAEPATTIDFVPEEYTIQGGHEEAVHLVLLKAPPIGIGGRGRMGPPGGGTGLQGGPSGRGGFVGPPRPENQAGPMPANSEATRPPGGTPVAVNSLPRLYIQCARPKVAFEKVLASLAEQRDQEIEGLVQDINLSRTGMRLQLLVIGLLALAAICVGGPIIVGAGLRPIGKLSEAVSRVSEKDFKLPFDEGDDLVRELVPIHSRLTQTLDLLRRAFSREKQAVADISHELRTPIAALMATIDVALRKTRTPEQYRTALEECRLISKQLGQLVERIMTLASLDAGNDRNEVSRTDGLELAAGCAAVIRPLAAANEIQVHIHPPEDLIELETDPAKLREVLMNLLHNAIEYNRPNGTIDLRLQREKSNAIFEVRDTGIGMTPEIKEKIFERFFRADPSRHATGVHAGLGLAIVKEYVTRLNGQIIVESEAGVGSVFRVVLPALPTHPDALDT